MAVYHINTRISSNLPPSYLLYDLCIYRLNNNKNKHCLINVKQQPVKITMKHSVI